MGSKMIINSWPWLFWSWQSGKRENYTKIPYMKIGINFPRAAVGYQAHTWLKYNVIEPYKTYLQICNTCICNHYYAEIGATDGGWRQDGTLLSLLHHYLRYLQWSIAQYCSSTQVDGASCSPAPIGRVLAYLDHEATVDDELRSTESKPAFNWIVKWFHNYWRPHYQHVLS